MLFLLVLFIPLLNGIKITNHFLEEPDDVETILGSTVVLPCRTESLDESQVTWCKNDFCTLGKTRDLPSYPRYKIIGSAHHGEHHFRISNVTLEDIGMYQCQIRAGPRRAGSMSRKAKLTVLQIPASLTIDSPVLLVENVLSFIVCRASNAMPEAKLTWHLPSSINYVSKNDYALIADQSLRNSISNITLIANRSYHGKFIQCQAHSSAIAILNHTMITQQYIHTIFAPEINMSVIGEPMEEKMIFIHCYVQARPELMKIQWFNGTKLLSLTQENRVSIYLTRFMHMNKIFCQATNQVGKRNHSITLQINYKPRFIDLDGNEEKNYSVMLVNEGESSTLECFVDSFPSSLISWKFNQQLMARNTTSIQINPIPLNKHIGLYLCLAQHPVFGIFNRTIRLALKGPPEMIEEKKIDSVYLGQSIRLRCSVSKDIPIESIFWSREDQSKITSNEKYEIRENQSDHLIEYKLSIKNMQLSDQGYYICTGINQFGSSITKFQLRVIDLKLYFIRRLLLYGSIAIGIFLSLILITFTLANHYRQHRNTKIRNKSSTTDETISSLAKQQEQIQQDETNSSIDQCLIHQHNHDLCDSPQDDLFYLRNSHNRYSTVV